MSLKWEHNMLSGVCLNCGQHDPTDWKCRPQATAIASDYSEIEAFRRWLDNLGMDSGGIGRVIDEFNRRFPTVVPSSPAEQREPTQDTPRKFRAPDNYRIAQIVKELRGLPYLTTSQVAVIEAYEDILQYRAENQRLKDHLRKVLDIHASDLSAVSCSAEKGRLHGQCANCVALADAEAFIAASSEAR